ncbi:YdcF family protein [Rhodoferax sp. TS-BS-61-7]|uniref:YdcF family protein n=1 Tax=Rhodoferax sp. TS-BS-61-7 TaxID=2094194 RepID=UPI000CF624FA|nr:YdcF family protein [Rhodoferax sp. TS-BS-61-7]PQA76174.1 YdcF family protein [Rhodoferax sp. TS-BS-61-7]
MFIASKILALITQPLLWVFVLLLLSLLVLRRWPRAGRRLVGTALAVLVLMAWKPLPEAIIRQLESRYPEMAPNAKLEGYVGVVVLGGATESGRTQMAHVQPMLNDAAERMTGTVAVLRANPQLRVLFTGGEGALMGVGQSEAERAKMFFDSLGLSGPQVQYESASRNTYENAVLTAKLQGVDPTQRWLLVTSAWHMPRSMATFAKAGWNVTAYPVDFRTGDSSDWLDFSMAGGAVEWQLALHELVGLLAYKLTGRL